MERSVLRHAIVLGTTLALVASLAGTSVATSGEPLIAHEGDADPLESGPTTQAPDEPGAAEPQTFDPARGLYVRPTVRRALVGDAKQFTAWFCDVPDSGSPFGPDFRPRTADDTCHRVLGAEWSLSDGTSASLVERKGPKVHVAALAPGVEVTVTATRGSRQGTATLAIAQPSDEPPGEPTKEPGNEIESAVVKPAAKAYVGPLLGTIGFRSAASLPVRDRLTGRSYKAKGLYVTTAITQESGQFKGRDSRLKARLAPNNLTVEMGLFRDRNGKFKLLGENGKWVALKNRVMQATASRSSAAWSFKVKKLKAGSAEVCISAYNPKGVRMGLLRLQSLTNPMLGVRAKGKPYSTCSATNKLALFVTDDIPASKPATRLLYPRTPADLMTRVRFTPPDWQKTLTASQRNRAIGLIDDYFAAFTIYTNQLQNLEQQELDQVADPLAVADEFDPGPKPGKIDWFGLAFSAVKMALPMLEKIEDLEKAAKVALEALAATQAIVEFGVALSDTIPSSGPTQKGRIIEGVTTANVAKKSVYRKTITDKWLRRTENSQLMHRLLKQGCAQKTKACDRRLWQWLKQPPTWPDQDVHMMQQQVFKSRVDFLKDILPLRGRLYAADGPWGWTWIGDDDYDRAWHIREWLGDAGDGTKVGFGRKQGNQDHQKYVLYTSVWSPWHHTSYRAIPASWRERPKAFGWAIGLKGDDEKTVTQLQSSTFDLLFEPYDPENPISGGLGLSYKEVACQWLTNTPYATYNRKSGNNGNNKNFNPCHFAFHDPSADKPTLRSDTARWIGPDDETSEATYRGASTAVALWLPDFVEVEAGRDPDDPDMFSWMIPHLKWGPVKSNPNDYPKSARRGTRQAVPVYFANLTQGDVTVHRILPAGSSQVISAALFDIPRWSEIDDRYSAAMKGPVPYDRDTPAIRRLRSYVGATYLVRTKGPGGVRDIGTYTVTKPPANSKVCSNEQAYDQKCAVAEIHGHFGGDDNDGILDR